MASDTPSTAELVRELRHAPASRGRGIDAPSSEKIIQAADRLEQLQAIVDRLPKTADGVPIAPDDVLWQIDPAGFILYGQAWSTKMNGARHVPSLPLYSTKEAAEKAMNTETNDDD